MDRHWSRWGVRALVVVASMACVAGGLQGAGAATAPAPDGSVLAAVAAPDAVGGLVLPDAKSGLVVPTNPPAPGLPSFYLGTTRSPCNPGPKSGLCRNQRPVLAQNGTATSALTVGTTDVVKVKQAIRLPVTLIGANLIGQYYNVISGHKSTQYRQSFPTRVFVQSPTGSPHPWGDLPAITSTALAFGMIPVTVTTHLSQVRDSSDLPIPIQIKVDSTPIPGSSAFDLFDVEASGLLTIRLDGVTIDGRPLDVGPSCRGVAPLPLAFLGKYVPVPGLRPTPPTYYYPIFGGDLYGSLDIPAFTGCRSASGEDFSQLFTSALSGKGNPVHLVQGATDAANKLGCPPEAAGLGCTLPVNTDKLTGPGAISSVPPTDPQGNPWKPNPTPCAWPSFLPNLPLTQETPPTDTCLKP
ncbi:hypothetical protein [Lapillicoccus sp.]|uniref:hypothetical protein n=1 Tax=Lapillicoccus sp. TaxID=1909287 RepID=UPI0025D52340|nr:hypothetical protein [Lapillicoccus sp.]